MLPEPFITRMQPFFGAEWNAFSEALQTVPPVSIRLNDKTPLLYTEIVPWCPDGRYLLERPLFTLDPLFHAGCYYVQEASSMFLWQALKQYVPCQSVVLDLCAAPGGKSTLISQYLGKEGFLVSNEVVRQRAFVLSENVQKWGNGNVFVSYNKPIDFGALGALFDVVVVDAPCSGEGMFRKYAGAIDEWSEANVQMCTARQRNILSGVWSALKSGGILIYSTCTYNSEENEENVSWICEQLGAEVLPLSIPAAWQVSDSGKGYHFYPHKTRGEGFFLSVMRKTDDSHQSYRIRIEKKKKSAYTENLAELRGWLLHPEEWEMEESERFISLYPARYADLTKSLSDKLIGISAGIGMAEMRGRKMVPQHGLAMAKELNREAFTVAEVDLDTALSYLRTEAITLESFPLGYVLLTYKNVPLGWVKNVGNRCNNLYPNEWRIRKK